MLYLFIIRVFFSFYIPLLDPFSFLLRVWCSMHVIVHVHVRIYTRKRTLAGIVYTEDGGLYTENEL